VQQLDVLLAKSRNDAGQPRDVATGPRKARHEPLRDRIGDDRHDNRDHGGGTLRGDRLARPGDDDGVNLRVDQLGNESRQTLRVAIREGRPDDEIPPLDIAQLAHPLDERLPGNSPCRIRADAQHTHVVHLPGRLRLGGERRGEEAARQGADERPTVHHSIT